MDSATYTVVLRSVDRVQGSSSNDCVLRSAQCLTTQMADHAWWRVTVKSLVLPVKRDGGRVDSMGIAGPFGTAFLEFRIDMGSLPRASDTRGATELVHIAPVAPLVRASETDTGAVRYAAPCVGAQNEVTWILARPTQNDTVRVRVYDDAGELATMAGIFGDLEEETVALSDWIIVLEMTPIVEHA